MNHSGLPFWHMSPQELCERLHSAVEGLSTAEAKKRLRQLGSSPFASKKRHTLLSLFCSQFKSPLILLLLGAALLSLSLKNRTDATLIFLIVIVSSLLSFFQEKNAVRAVEKLLSLVRVKTLAFRDGKTSEIDIDHIVQGDVISLSAGDIVPGDCLILESRDCYVDEATLTGETFHVEKTAGILPLKTQLSERSNSLFLGSHVISGTARVLVVATGKATEFGRVSEHLKLRAPETSFEKGTRQFGYLLLEVTLIMTLTIFAFNVYLQRPVLESFLFAMALAVGLTPQLLPAIISINLAHGAKRMAKKKVIVKKLSSIENIGSMDVLCVDKTGTLTHGVIELSYAMDPRGNPSEHTLLHAYLNATFQTGYENPIDKAILAKKKIDISSFRKCDEIPYDFVRKRLSVLVSSPQGQQMITKGAFSSVLSICQEVRIEEGKTIPLAEGSTRLQEQFEAFCKQGYRVLGLASKTTDKTSISRKDEKGFVFIGFLLFFDPPKEGVEEIISKLREAHVNIKIITGDHSLVATHIAEQIGLVPPHDSSPHLLRGEEIRKMSDRALTH